MNTKALVKVSTIVNSIADAAKETALNPWLEQATKTAFLDFALSLRDISISLMEEAEKSIEDTNAEKSKT